MNKGNGASASLGVLAEITALLAAITPEQFTVPMKKRKEGDHAVTAATDDIKQFFTLMSRLTDECRKLKTSANQVSESAMKEVFAKGILQADKDLKTSGTSLFEAKTTVEQIAIELQRTNSLREIVAGIFWHEVRNQHSDLMNKPVISICNDWSLTWTERDDDDGLQISFRLIDVSNMAGLAEMLERHTLQ